METLGVQSTTRQVLQLDFPSRPRLAPNHFAANPFAPSHLAS